MDNLKPAAVATRTVSENAKLAANQHEQDRQACRRSSTASLARRHRLASPVETLHPVEAAFGCLYLGGHLAFPLQEWPVLALQRACRECVSAASGARLPYAMQGTHDSSCGQFDQPLLPLRQAGVELTFRPQLFGVRAEDTPPRESALVQGGSKQSSRTL